MSNPRIDSFVTTKQHHAEVLGLYPEMFPDEDLTPLVTALLALDQNTLSLATCEGDKIVGHILFTRCGLDRPGREIALLGPLGVVPAHQRRGHGTALIEAGIEMLRQDGVERVVVLGNPAYYGRFGFATEIGIEPPFPILAKWAEAWQSLRLVDSDALNRAGRLIVPEPWNDPALWSG